MNHRKLWSLSAAPALAAAGLMLAFLLLGRGTAGAAPGGEVTSAVPRSLSANFTVSGTVTGLSGGLALSGVEVFVWNRDQGSGFVGDTTGVSGTYSVTLVTGNYDLSFNPPYGSGYASRSYKGIGGPSDVVLDVALPDGYAVSGTVYASGSLSTVSNTAIYAYNHNTADGFGLPPTGPDGQYFIGLVTGTHDLSFTPPACTDPRLGPKTEVITITQDMTRNAVLPPGFTVAGCISDENGSPVPGVQVYAYDPNIRGFGFAPSHQSGCYTGTLPLGTFDIQFIPPAERGLGPLTIVDVVSETTSCPNTSLPITLPAGYTVSGTVTCQGEPLKNAFVYADPAGPPAPGDDLDGWGLYTVDDGSYRLPVVPSVYTFTLVPPPATGFETRVISNVQVLTDTVLDVNFCPIYLPIILKNYLQL